MKALSGIILKFRIYTKILVYFRTKTIFKGGQIIMENFKKLLRVAKMLELKYIIAQAPSAPQSPPGTNTGEDIAVRTVLENNRLLDINLPVPFISQAGIPDDAKINIFVNVKPGYNVSFDVTAIPRKPDRGNFPPGPPGDAQFKSEMVEYGKKVPLYSDLGKKLSLLLLKNLSQKMSIALKKANPPPPVNDLIKINWVEF